MGTTVKAPAPDPAIGQASQDAIDLAKQQYSDQKALLDEYNPLFKQQVEFNLAQQQKYADQGDQAYEDYNTYFRPLEQKYAQTAADYNTAGRRDQAANEAQAGVAQQFGTARDSLNEDLASQNVGGAAAASLRGSLGVREAMARASAGDAARRSVENTGLSLMSSATNLGRGFPSQGLQAGQAAQASGQGAQGSVAGLSGLTSAGYGQALQGYGVGINGLLGQYQAQAQQAGTNRGIWGDLLGAGLTAYGMYSSTKTAKTPGEPVKGEVALRGLESLPVESWRYKPGMGDGGEHVGPYAEDVQKRFGDTVAPGGKAIDMVAMGKINAEAIAELARHVATMRKKVAEMEAA